MIARIVVAVVALSVLGWLGVMERDARLQASGLRAAARVHEPAGVARAISDLRGARLVNPDTTPDIDRAFVYEGAGRRRRAVALIQDVLRREPDNLTAWNALRAFAGTADPRLAARALAALRRLDPLSAPRR